ncbi:MAG: type II CAAX endopeptidase family protein [Chloroflexota bacterium]|jgi:membrane protease YdiL (CAAX protease family)
MNPFTSAFNIFVGLLVYLIVAVGTALLVKKSGGNLKEIAGRTSTTILLLGGAANLIVLVLTLLLVVWLNKMPLSALGLAFSRQGALFVLVGAASTVLLAIAFTRWRQRGEPGKSAEPSAASTAGTRQLIIGSVVLLVVAVQEELLYRGYITLNLSQLNSIWILIITTVIFVLIHFLTNRVGKYEIVSWTVSGLVLAAAYLVSGSIWVPIILHLATDLTNVLVFHIIGPVAGTAVIPAKDRAVFRVVYGVVIVGLLAMFYQTAVYASSPTNEVFQANDGRVSITNVQISSDQVLLSGQSTLPQGACIHTMLRAANKPVTWWPADKCADADQGQWEVAVRLGQDDVPAQLDQEQEYVVRAQVDGGQPIKSQPFVFDLTGPPIP